jgi:hypothetical protein
MRCDPFVQRRHPNAKIIRHLLACKPAGPCDTHRILAEFVRPFQSRSQAPLLQ